MSKRELGIGLAVAAGLVTPLLTSTAAEAQEWLKDRRYAEGVGIKAGDSLELHPGIAGEVGYDSNYLLESQKSGANIINAAPQNPVQGTGMLRITPSLSIATVDAQRRGNDGGQPEPPKVRFRAGLSATYREFLFNSALASQRNVSAAVDARAEILPERPWGAVLNAGYVRVIQPTVLGDPNLSFNRDDISAGAALTMQPGSGTLDWQFGYQFHATLFEDAEGTPLDNLTHEASTRGRWKFRPKTALLYDATLRFMSYTNASSLPGGLHNSTPLRARVGLTGLVTPRLSVLALVGYGASFFAADGNPAVQQYDSFIGQAEAKFFLTANPGTDAPGAVSLTLSSLAVGFVRDFQNSYLGDFYGSDKGYVRLQWFFAGRALVGLEGNLGAIEYPTIFNPDGTPRHASFTDIRAESLLFGEYRFTDSFAINTTLSYAQNFSSTQLATPTLPAQPQSAAEGRQDELAPQVAGSSQPNVAAVALANKNARVVWALLANDREFRSDYTPAVAAA